MPGYDEWSKVKEDVVKKGCSAEGEDTEFDYGIFKGAVESDIISSTNFGEKFLYCLWFGLKSLRYVINFKIIVFFFFSSS